MTFLRARLVKALIGEWFWRNVQDVSASAGSLASVRFRDARVDVADLELRLGAIERERRDLEGSR